MPPWKKGNRLQVVLEGAADDATRVIFWEIQQALGIPELRVYYPALAVYPHFLQLHWNTVRPLVQSGEFFACADRLRADAYTRAHNYLRIPDLCARLQEPQLGATARQELTAAMDLFHYLNPLLLLLFCAQMQALEGPVGEAKAPLMPNSHPVYAESPVLVHEQDASAPVRRRYEEIRRVLELPYVNSEYEAMARFPVLLDVYWDLLKRLLQSPVYQESQYGIRESAWSLVRELPGPIELSIEQLLDAGMKQENIGPVVRILDLFVRNLSGLLINVAIAKIALEGGNLAADRKPAATKPDSERVA